MKKIAVLATALALLASSLNPASAALVPVTPAPAAGVVAGSSAGLAAWLAGGVIGVAAFLGIYDFGRRTTCSGDFLQLGGPGFDRRVVPTDNVLPPVRCSKG
jgi:hypothetical protein